MERPVKGFIIEGKHAEQIWCLPCPDDLENNLKGHANALPVTNTRPHIPCNLLSPSEHCCSTLGTQHSEGQLTPIVYHPVLQIST